MNKLNEEWEYRRKLWKEAASLFFEAQGLLQEKYKKTRENDIDSWLSVEEYKKYERMDNLFIEANQIWKIANKFWLDTILKTYGNIKIKWKGYGKVTAPEECHLENGEIYKFEK